jgi:cadmium resistance protein CadD (predicted permease)
MSFNPEIIKTVGVGILTFAATNLDDLILLIVLFSKKNISPNKIILGQILGISLLIAVSWLGSELGLLLIPARYFRLLGIIPLFYGVYKLIEPISVSKPKKIQRMSALTVTALTFAAGGDNIAVYTALFLNNKWENRILLTTIYLVMTLLWCALAILLVSNKGIEVYLRRNAGWALPAILITIGIYLLGSYF